MPWLGPAVVAAVWGLLSTLLLVQSWVAAVRLLIALLGLARARLRPYRAFEVVVGALVSGAVCSAFLRLGFWWLVEVRGYGLTWLERGVYLGFVVVAAGFLLPRLPPKVKADWRQLMGPESADEGTGKEAGTS